MKTIRFAALCAVALLAGLSLPASAQEIQKPTYKVGEWCNYKDGFGNTFRRTVSDVRADGSFSISTGSRVREYNPDHHLISNGGRKITPYWGGPAFPLKAGQRVGEKWEFAYTTSKGRGAKAELTLVSVRPDTVTVPAGTFQTLRVETEMQYRLDTGFANRLDNIVWYALDPKIKQYVKLESTDYGVRGGGKTEAQLMECGGAESI
jgi:hypothetical protein